jgi:hypothetical protein
MWIGGAALLWILGKDPDEGDVRSIRRPLRKDITSRALGELFLTGAINSHGPDMAVK